MSFVRQHKGAVVWSVALHLAVLVGAMIGIPWPERARVAVPTAPIQGVIIDTAAIERAQAEKEEAARQVRVQQQRQQREERERVAAAEQKRIADEREKQRVADAERERVAAAKREQERRDQERRDQERRDREAQAQREKEAAEKRERDRQAAEQRRRESELQAALDAESDRANAEAAGLLDQYIRAIEARIRQNWNRPLSAKAGIDCVVNVVQLQSGDVMSVNVGACNGDDAVRRSIEDAVRRASPLPKPPNPSLFERNLVVNFRPDE
jgi:colicin import membrane protein